MPIKKPPGEHGSVEKLLAGDRRTLARLISEAEAGSNHSRKVLREVYRRTGHATVVGFTGPLGVGKSSLINRVVNFLRRQGKTVGVIAIDPTSPFSGGALLGDRVRLERREGDTGVFVRSMATRGHSGGVAQSTRDVIRLMEAFGLEVIIVETVGSGQSDVDIHDIASTRVVVLVPHLGDDVQSLKAGLFEIADVFAVNKSDLPGSMEAARHLKEMAGIMAPRDGWRPHVVEASAVASTGVEDLWSAIQDHQGFLQKNQVFEREARERLAKEVRELVRGEMEARLSDLIEKNSRVKGLIEEVTTGKLDPYSGADRLAALVTKDQKSSNRF